MKLILENWREYINEIRMPALRGWHKIPLGSVVRLLDGRPYGYTESDLFLYDEGSFGLLYFIPLNIVDTGDESGIANSRAHTKTPDKMHDNDKIYKINRQGYPKWLEVVIEPDKVGDLIGQFRSLMKQLIPKDAKAHLSIDNMTQTSHIAYETQTGDKIPRYHPVNIDVESLAVKLSKP